MREPMIGPFEMSTGREAWLAPDHVSLVVLDGAQASVRLVGNEYLVSYDIVVNEDVHAALMAVLTHPLMPVAADNAGHEMFVRRHG